MRRLEHGHELLDGELDPVALRGNLRDLARVNRWLDGASLSWSAIRPFLRERARTGARPSLLDVGTGAGDIPLALLRRAAGRFRLSVTATDVRPEIVAAATVTLRGTPAVVEQVDAGAIDEADRSFDIVHCSLVMHHLEPDAAKRLLGEMRRVAASAVVINDLDRRWLWWAGAWLMTRVLTRNRYTRHDAPLSVRRAYRPDEVSDMAAATGLREVARYWAWPRYRYALVFVPDR